MIVGVESVEPSSTTISSTPRKLCSSTLSIAWRMVAAPLNTGIIAETFTIGADELMASESEGNRRQIRDTSTRTRLQPGYGGAAWSYLNGLSMPINRDQ